VYHEAKNGNGHSNGNGNGDIKEAEEIPIAVFNKKNGSARKTRVIKDVPTLDL
jgi:hypothetical protein